MTDTKQKRRLRDGIDTFGEPVKAPHWKVYFFLSGGGGGFADPIFPSENEAKKWSDEKIDAIERYGTFKIDRYGVKNVPASEIICAIQIPVKP